MQTTKFSTGGLVTFWTLAEFTDRAKLGAAWEASGFGEFVPEERAHVSVLKDALSEVFGGTHYLVRPLATKDGFAVVREVRGSDENSYSAVLTAKVFGDSEPVLTGDTTKAFDVVMAYHKHAGRVTSQQMSAASVRILYKLGGTRLRPSGSVYWLPGDQAESWAAAVAGFEGAAHGGKSVGYAIRHELDADSVVAVRDAIVHEVTTEAARLNHDILSGDLGQRAVETRKREALLLKSKVTAYEDILGVGLAHLKATLDQVDQTSATAALLLAADPFTAEVDQEVAHAAVA